MAWVTLPDDSKVWCRDCDCGTVDASHTKECEFYKDYAAALTDFVYEDDTERVIPPFSKLN